MPVDSLFKKEIKKPAEIHNPRNLAGLSAIVKSIEKLQQEINRPISVENIDYIKLYLKDELKILANAIQTIINAIKFPKSIEVSNLEKYPDTLKIQELKQVIEAIHDLRAITSQLELNPTINVEAPIIPEIKIPLIKVPRPEVTVKSPQINVKAPEVEIDLSGIIRALKPLELITDKAGRPISVRLSDGEKFIKELSKIVGKQERWVTAFSQSKGMSEDEYKNASKTVGKCYHRTPLAINSTAQAIIANKTSIEIVNTGTKNIYYGGAGVTSSNGFPLYLRSWKSWVNVKRGWTIYLVTDGADTSTLRINDYD